MADRGQRRFRGRAIEDDLLQDRYPAEGVPDDQIFLRAEVAEERALGHSRLVGDVPHGGLRHPPLGEQPVRRLLQRLPGGEFVRFPAAERGCTGSIVCRRQGILVLHALTSGPNELVGNPLPAQSEPNCHS